MRSPVSELILSNSQESVIDINPPTIFNGFPVGRSWKEDGGRSKNINVISHGKFKLTKCPNAYVLLCVGDRCINLALTPNFKCKTHEKGEEVYVYCRSGNCTKYCSYGHEYKKPLYCKDHKEPDMIYVTREMCKFTGCRISRIFGIKGGDAEYCETHKHEGMINVVSKRCDFLGCDKHKIFGNEGESFKYCSEHKGENMIDLRHKHCEFTDCKISPYFGVKGGKAQFCIKHKHEGMIDVINKRCESQDCTTHAGFNFAGELPLYCTIHKHEGMIDVHNKRCEVSDCMLCSSYGKLYSKNLTYCKKHSSLNHYYKDKVNPICYIISCQNTAYFVDVSDPNIYPIHCHIHSRPTDIELILKECPNCHEEIYFPIDKKICLNCGNYRERKRQTFREDMMNHFFTSNDIPFVHDRPVSSIGSKYRPDFVIKSKFGYIIVEVDEYQHKRYTQEEEINRTLEIYCDFKSINSDAQVLFMRFNPDGYKGIKFNLKERYEYLHNIIMHFMNLPGIGVSLAQLKLFYDGFTGSPNIESL